MAFHEEAFEAAAKITAAVAEEADIELNAKGAEKAAEFFSVLYKKLAAVAKGEELHIESKTEETERIPVRVKVSCEAPKDESQIEEEYSNSWACEEEVFE